MSRPKGYKLSEEAKKRIGEASRKKWVEKRFINSPPVANMTITENKKKWFEFWK